MESPGKGKKPRRTAPPRLKLFRRCGKSCGIGENQAALGDQAEKTDFPLPSVERLRADDSEAPNDLFEPTPPLTALISSRLNGTIWPLASSFCGKDSFFFISISYCLLTEEAAPASAEHQRTNSSHLHCHTDGNTVAQPLTGSGATIAATYYMRIGL